jgi:hypothetical protein
MNDSGQATSQAIGYVTAIVVIVVIVIYFIVKAGKKK